MADASTPPVSITRRFRPDAVVRFDLLEHRGSVRLWKETETNPVYDLVDGAIVALAGQFRDRVGYTVTVGDEFYCWVYGRAPEWARAEFEHLAAGGSL